MPVSASFRLFANLPIYEVLQLNVSDRADSNDNARLVISRPPVNAKGMPADFGVEDGLACHLRFDFFVSHIFRRGAGGRKSVLFRNSAPETYIGARIPLNVVSPLRSSLRRLSSSDRAFALKPNHFLGPVVRPVFSSSLPGRRFDGSNIVVAGRKAVPLVKAGLAIF